MVDVLPDRGMGRFGMTPSQQEPLGAWVALRQLQRALDQRGWVTSKLIPQERRPDRTVYSITAKGREALAAWLAEYGTALRTDIGRVATIGRGTTVVTITLEGP